MVMDGDKAQIQGSFQRKLREAGCHIKQTEQHKPKSNSAEGSIRELKRSVGRKMVRPEAPKGYGMTAWLGKLMSDHQLHYTYSPWK
jgi:hypothetical protein